MENRQFKETAGNSKQNTTKPTHSSSLAKNYSSINNNFRAENYSDFNSERNNQFLIQEIQHILRLLNDQIVHSVINEAKRTNEFDRDLIIK